MPEILFAVSEKSYEREIEEGEAIWRTLPLFPVSFGFAVALIGFSWVSAPDPKNDLITWVTYGLISTPVLLFFPAFRWLWKMVKPRTFRYLPRDLKIVEYAESLRAFHSATHANDSDREAAAAADLKAYLLGEWAAAASQNQEHNQARSYARGRTAFYLMACIALALLSNALILVGEKFGFPETKQDAVQPPAQGRPAALTSPGTSRAAEAAIY